MGQVALQKAGLPRELGTPVLQTLPSCTAHQRERPECPLEGDREERSEVQRLQEALGQALTQNKALLDQADVLCAMKEAADLEVKRLQEKLAKFVDDVQHSGKAAVSLRRALLPRTPQHRPMLYDDDDDSD